MIRKGVALYEERGGKAEEGFDACSPFSCNCAVSGNLAFQQGSFSDQDTWSISTFTPNFSCGIFP
jgi:hypothetical protein